MTRVAAAVAPLVAYEVWPVFANARYSPAISLGSIIAAATILAGLGMAFYLLRSNLVTLLKDEVAAQKGRCDRLEEELHDAQEQMRQREHAFHAVESGMRVELAELKGRPDYGDVFDATRQLAESVHDAVAAATEHWRATAERLAVIDRRLADADRDET